MKAILFPGQGSQVVGMGSDFYKNFKHVREIFSEADEVLKFKLSKIIMILIIKIIGSLLDIH